MYILKKYSRIYFGVWLQLIFKMFFMLKCIKIIYIFYFFKIIFEINI